MACPDVEQLLDAFVDTELPPPQLLDVARHAAGCAACDRAIRDLTALRQSVAVLVEREGRALDLSGVWPAIAGALDATTTIRTDRLAGRPPRQPVRQPVRQTARQAARLLALQRAVPAAPVWGALMALAASVFFWFSAPPSELSSEIASKLTGTPHGTVTETQVASVPRTGSGFAPARAMGSLNHADIDRLSGKDIAVRREPKSGTTIIWVNHAVEESR